MDGSTNAFNGNSQRRKLIKNKKPPSSFQVKRSSAGFEGGFDAQSLQSKRSSHSLRRAPSAPPARSHPATASNGSSPRHLPTSNSSLHVHANAHAPTATATSSASSSNNALRPNPSPILPQGDFVFSNSSTSSPLGHHSNRLSDPHLRPLNHTAQDDFIGAPFDGAAILNRIESTKLSSPTSSTQRSNAPAPLVKAGTDSRLVSPKLRTSTSFTAMEAAMMEKAQGPRPTENQFANTKRYSDDGKELKAVLRKKTGFSGFMNSLVGSPKKPVISAPENPVHVTHVGYDSATGQFTVSINFFFGSNF